MTYKTNTPNFNSNNRKVFHFNDFINNINDEELELKKMKRGFPKNDGEIQNPGFKHKFNKVTRKIDDLSKDMIDDKIEDIEDLKESVSMLKVRDMIDIAMRYDSRARIDFDDTGIKIIGNFSEVDDSDRDIIKKKSGEVTDSMILVQSYGSKY